MSTLTVAREQTARIARLNDLARSAMGVACTAVATVGFRSLPEADQSRVRELIETYDVFDECGSACKKDPVSGVIGVQKGPLISMV